MNPGNAILNVVLLTVSGVVGKNGVGVQKHVIQVRNNRSLYDLRVSKKLVKYVGRQSPF